jgi:hypothetical protein
MPPLKPGKIVSKSGNVINAKNDSELSAKSQTAAKPKSTPKGGPGAKAQTQGSLSTAKAVKKYVTDPGKDFKGVGQNFYGSAKTTVKKPSGGGGGGDGGDGALETQSVTIVSAPVASGIVDNVNVKEQYQAEAKRIILSLVKSAKDLLIKYNFSSINRISEYALDADNESKTEYTIAYKARPEPTFTLGQAELQDRFSLDVAQISNQISDSALDTVKFACFGSLVGGRYSPGSVKISGGNSLYDMKLEINSICGKDFIIKCYEIS